MDSSNQLYLLGMLNSFRTGNPLFDGIFILLLPAIMNYLSQFTLMIINKFNQSMIKISNQDYYVQRLEYSIITGVNGNYPPNYYLYTAICMYTNSLNIDIKNSDIESFYNLPETDTEAAYRSMGPRKTEIKHLKVISKPGVNIFINILGDTIDDDVELMFEKKHNSPNSNSSNSTISLLFVI